MSKRINPILVIFVCIVFLSGCSSARIPVGYRLNPRDVKREFTGSWIEVNMHPYTIANPETKLSGELIAVQSDTLYILTKLRLSSIQLNKIQEATLYIYYNQAGKYALATGLLYLPDIIAAIANSISGFLAIGVPWILGGSIIACSVGLDDSNLLIYPGRNRIEDFRKFARFPQGIPKGVVKDKLYLISTK
jgi:hypothetical protein